MSFKVRCITQQDFAPHVPEMEGFKPEIGDIVTVTNTLRLWGLIWYELAEEPHPDAIYDARNFALINGPDERELLEAREQDMDKVLMALAENLPEEELDPTADKRIMANLKERFGW